MGCPGSLRASGGCWGGECTCLGDHGALYLRLWGSSELLALGLLSQGWHFWLGVLQSSPEHPPARAELPLFSLSVSEHPLLSFLWLLEFKQWLCHLLCHCWQCWLVWGHLWVPAEPSTAALQVTQPGTGWPHQWQRHGGVEVSWAVSGGGESEQNSLGNFKWIS